MTETSGGGGAANDAKVSVTEMTYDEQERLLELEKGYRAAREAADANIKAAERALVKAKASVEAAKDAIAVAKAEREGLD